MQGCPQVSIFMAVPPEAVRPLLFALLLLTKPHLRGHELATLLPSSSIPAQQAAIRK